MCGMAVPRDGMGNFLGASPLSPFSRSIQPASPRAGNRLIMWNRPLFEGTFVRKGLERRHRLYGGAIGVRDDALVAHDILRVHLRHHKGHTGSMRHCELLSMTRQPFAAAMGANFALVPAPAEKSAMSMPLSKEVSVSSSTVYSLPIKVIFLPAERYEAKT